MRLLLVSIIILSTTAEIASAKTVVTTVVETQKKRESTRWTLTEWLKIKERIKLMDVWLAMFSSPQKDKFAPELSLTYIGLVSELSLNHLDAPAVTKLEDVKSQEGRVQFWLTNLVSGTTGLKTPNIDLGFDYVYRKPESELAINRYINNDTSIELNNKQLQYQTVNLRLFGANIQDSSLIIKYGNYKTDRGFVDPSEELSDSSEGVVAGVESYFYLLKWLGVEGHYLRFGNSKGAAGSDERNATHSSYSLFLELYNLRIGYGVWQENWNWLVSAYDFSTEEQGSFLTVKLQF